MGCAIECVKLVLFIFNLIFALCGLSLLGVGIMYKLQMDDYAGFVLEGIDMKVAPILFIVIGSIIFIISFFGCCGTIRENHCMVVTYATILLSILIIQIAIGVFLYMGNNKNNTIDEVITNNVKKLFSNYKDDPKAQKTFDGFQDWLHCCGVDGPSDYTLKHFMTRTPQSCCIHPNENPNGCQLIPLNVGANYWTEGCLEKMEKWVHHLGIALTAIIAIIIGVEIVGIVLALCLANSIKNAERRMGV